MTWQLIEAVGSSHLLLSAVGGAMVGIVASVMFAINFRLWNKYEGDPRFGPQLICLCSYFLNLTFFLLTFYYAVQLWEPWNGNLSDMVAFFLVAAGIFAVALRTRIIPKRKAYTKKQ
jgi:pilus assembly protein TadC